MVNRTLSVPLFGSPFVSPAKRAARMRGFFSLVKDITGPVRVLDIGGTAAFWLAAGLPRHMSVHLVNTHPEPESPRVTSEVGDARSLRWDDNSFDIVFSNSCIGHVGELADQAKMAIEVRRLAPRYWVQSPNKWFPLDWRTRLPCLHWLPREARAILYRMLPICHGKRAKSMTHARRVVAMSRDLTRREMKSMFPDATVRTEQAWGFAKSFIACRW